MAFINLKIAEAITYPSVNLVFSDDTTDIKDVIALNYVTNLKAVTSNTVTVYLWQRRKDGGGWQNLTSTSVNTKQDVINVEGVYDYRCKIVDNNGLESAYSNIISINFTLQDLQAPVADIDVVGDLESTNESVTVVEGDSVALTGEQSVANNEGTISSYFWEIISKPANDEASLIPNGSLFTLNNLSLGNYVIKLTVTDSAGLTATTTFAITSEINANPILDIIYYDDAKCVISGVWNDGNAGELRFNITFKGLQVGETYIPTLVSENVSAGASLNSNVPVSFVAQATEMTFTYDITFTNQTDQNIDVNTTISKQGESGISESKTHFSSNTAHYDNWDICNV